MNKLLLAAAPQPSTQLRGKCEFICLSDSHVQNTANEYAQTVVNPLFHLENVITTLLKVASFRHSPTNKKTQKNFKTIFMVI